MKKILVSASENVRVSQDKVFLAPAKDQAIGLHKADHIVVHIKGHLKNAAGEDLYAIWTVSSALFSKNIFLRGVEVVADGWQVVLDCSHLTGGDLNLVKDAAILVGRVFEPVLLHRVGSDVASNGARILG